MTFGFFILNQDEHKVKLLRDIDFQSMSAKKQRLYNHLTVPFLPCIQSVANSDGT